MYSVVSRRNLHDYVYAIGLLPQHPSILFDTEGQKIAFNTLKNRYSSASLWLRHILLGEALKPEAYQEALSHEPLAELLAAEFRLSVAVYARTTNPEILQFESPAALWFYGVVGESQAHLESVGLTGIPNPIGKREAWKAGIEIFSKLHSRSYDPGFPPLTIPKDLLEIVALEAQAIARSDENFYFDHLLPFVRAGRRFLKKEKHCKSIQFYHLSLDGELVVSEKNKKLGNRKLSQALNDKTKKELM